MNWDKEKHGNPLRYIYSQVASPHVKWVIPH